MKANEWGSNSIIYQVSGQMGGRVYDMYLDSYYVDHN